MEGFNPSPQDGNIISGGIGPQLKPNTLNIKVLHGLNQHQFSLPSNSTFGELKSAIVQKLGLRPETQKLLFRGKEKEDNDDLQTAGVKDNSVILLMEDVPCQQKCPEEAKQKRPEEAKETNVISRGSAAVAQVRKEVDKLSEQVSALQAVLDSGAKVDNKDIIYLTEMLMRQLLKLDGIEAEGEGKVQRKMEVRRVQSFVETMDILKSRNSNPFTNGNSTVSVTTQWETFDPGYGGVSAASSLPSSAATPIPSSTPTPMPISTPIPSSTSTPMPYSSPTPMPYSSPIPSSTPTPTPMPYSSPTPMPNSSPTPMQMPYSTPTPMPYSSPTPMPNSSPTPMPYSTPSPIPNSSHTPMPSSIPTPVPTPAPTLSPNHVPSSVPLSMPASTKVTQDWEKFY